MKNNLAAVGRITHIEELPVNDFIYWLENINKHNVEMFQKLDGTINLSVYKKDNIVYLSRINKKQYTNITNTNIPKTPSSNVIRSVIDVINKVKHIFNNELIDGDIVDLEILYGKQPNTINYNLDKCYIAFLRFINILDINENYNRTNKIYNAFKDLNIKSVYENISYDWTTKEFKTEIKTCDWGFIIPEKLNISDINLDFTTDINDIKTWCSQKNSSIPVYTNTEILNIKLNNIPKVYIESIRNARNTAQNHINYTKKQIKNKLLRVISDKTYFTIGKNNQEGLVICDNIGNRTKLIDIKKFTDLNKYNWRHIEYATDGIKYNGSHIIGIVQNFFNFNAEIFSFPAFKHRQKLFKFIREYSSTEIKKYIIDSNITVVSAPDKIIKIIALAKLSSEKTKSLYHNELLSDTQLSNDMIVRSADSLGCVYDAFIKIEYETKNMNFYINTHDTFIRYLMLLYEVFSNIK